MTPEASFTRPATIRGIHFVATKKKSVKRPNIDPAQSTLILWYLGTAVFWLVLGTSAGEYLGIKFVSPDVDSVSWAEFWPTTPGPYQRRLLGMVVTGHDRPGALRGAGGR